MFIPAPTVYIYLYIIFSRVAIAIVHQGSVWKYMPVF